MTNRVIPNNNFSVFPPIPSHANNTAARFRMLINSEPILTCPLLGLKEDPETITNFASHDNYCHCKGHPRTIPLDYQQMYCLLGYTQCPVYLKRMAKEVEQAEGRQQKPASQPKTGMVGLLVNLLGIK